MDGAVKGAAAVFSYPEWARVVNKDAPPGQQQRCASSIYNKKRTLCEQHAPNAPAIRWWHTDADGVKHELAPKASEGEEISAFEVDRDWRYVAIVSAAEGHPLLDIYDLNVWILSGNRPDSLYTLNPYPGGLHLSGWENNELLHGLSYHQEGLSFSTDGPISAKESASGTWPLEKSRYFRFDPYAMKLILVEHSTANPKKVKEEKSLTQ